MGVIAYLATNPIIPMQKVNFFQEIITWDYSLLHILSHIQLLNMRYKFFIHNVTYQPHQIYIDSRLFTQVHIKTLCLLQK